MLGVTYVVERNKTKRDRCTAGDLELAVAFGLRDVCDDMSQVPVVGAPQVNEFRPLPIVVVLRSDPEFLRVSREAQVAFRLDANKPLVVVRGGINEMTEDLLGRPFANRR